MTDARARAADSKMGTYNHPVPQDQPCNSHRDLEDHDHES